MTYIIDGIEFNLSNPINKYWYSKFKKSLIKDQTNNFIKIVLTDAKNKNKIKYSPQYYACAKFIKATTNLKYKKEQKKIYWVFTINDDFWDTYTVKDKSELVCSRANKLVLDKDYESRCCGSKIGKCKNGCCQFLCKTKKFYIQWE
jgi:hypothetical protein